MARTKQQSAKLERQPHVPSDLIMLRIKEEYRHERNLAHDTLRIGLDMSVDSTGLVLVIGNQCCGALFVNDMPPIDDSSDSINYVPYRKEYSFKNYSVKEYSKMLTIRTLSNKIINFIEMFMQQLWPIQPKYIRIVLEGAAMGYMSRNSNSLVDLMLYRGVIQDAVYHHFPLGTEMSFDVIAPKALKKEFTGDGNADKLKVLETFVNCIESIHWCGKLDDVGDSFALATSNMLTNPSPRLW